MQQLHQPGRHGANGAGAHAQHHVASAGGVDNGLRQVGHIGHKQRLDPARQPQTARQGAAIGGHHPVEMAATLAAARGAFPGQRLVLAFQPHRYTRPRDCFEDFVQVIGSADAVLLTEVYAAGETPLVAADGRALARGLRLAGRVEPLFVADVADLPQAIADTARAGDVVLCMGAGTIGAVPARVVDLLQDRELLTLVEKAA